MPTGKERKNERKEKATTTFAFPRLILGYTSHADADSETATDSYVTNTLNDLSLAGLPVLFMSRDFTIDFFQFLVRMECNLH